MATQIRRVTNPKQVIRFKRKKRIRSKIEGSAEKPRLSVFRSHRNLYVQLVDDVKGHTLVAASSLEEEFRGKIKNDVEGARVFGGALAQRALAKQIAHVVLTEVGMSIMGASRLWLTRLVRAV